MAATAGSVSSNSVNHHHDEPFAQPKPQIFWLLSTLAMAVVILSAAQAFPATENARADIDAATLIELADAGDQTTPELIEAPRLALPADDAEAPATTEAEASDTTEPLAAIETDIDPAGPSLAADDSPTGPPSTVTEALAFDDLATVDDKGQFALTTISYPWEELLPEWSIEFLPERDGLYGLTLVPERKIEIYIRDGQTVELLSHVIAHELGHAVDVEFNDGPDRRIWEDARGIDSEPWWPGNGATDFSTGAGDFAESFAAWQVGDHSFRSRLGEPPTAEQVELLASLAAG